MDVAAVTGIDVRRVFEQTETDPGWSFAECKRSDTAKWTHSYHSYPAKFIPQLVERLFEEYLTRGAPASINDPFMGSGTTIVSAIANGYTVSGTDINGIAALMSRVKATPIEPMYLARKLARFEERIAFLNPTAPTYGSDQCDIKPVVSATHAERIDYWFTNDNKRDLGYILGAIHEEVDPMIRDYLLVAFSHILKSTSMWMQTSTKPTRDFKKVPKNPYRAIIKHLKKMWRGNHAFFEVVPENVRQNLARYLNVGRGDAKEQPVLDGTVDLVITSSPYVTSYEYADLHQLSTIWLDLAVDLTDYKKGFIGTAHKKCQGRRLKSIIAQGIIDKMNEVDCRVAEEIQAFFLDMEDVIAESCRILKPGGRACYVIGDTRLKEVDILNAEVFAETMVAVGLSLDRVIKREIPSRILPQTRDSRTGRFASAVNADKRAYPCEYIVIGRKDESRW